MDVCTYVVNCSKETRKELLQERPGISHSTLRALISVRWKVLLLYYLLLFSSFLEAIFSSLSVWYRYQEVVCFPPSFKAKLYCWYCMVGVCNITGDLFLWLWICRNWRKKRKRRGTKRRQKLWRPTRRKWKSTRKKTALSLLTHNPDVCFVLMMIMFKWFCWTWPHFLLMAPGDLLLLFLYFSPFSFQQRGNATWSFFFLVESLSSFDWNLTYLHFPNAKGTQWHFFGGKLNDTFLKKRSLSSHKKESGSNPR